MFRPGNGFAGLRVVRGPPFAPAFGMSDTNRVPLKDVKVDAIIVDPVSYN